MADISVTAASVVVLAGTDPNKLVGTAGETVTAGQAIALDTTTSKLVKADSNHATPSIRKAIGIALNGAALNQPLVVQRGGDITMGATLTPGAAVYLSDTPGGLCPLADVGAGEYVCLIGLAKSASVLSIDIQYPNVVN